MLKLTVVNRMLKTLGERSLTSLTDSHRMLGDCLDTLAEVSTSIQAKGWWWNMEQVTLLPSTVDSAIYLPNDCLSVRMEDREVAKRGNRLYDLDDGGYEFSGEVRLELIRDVEFEDLPELGADYIAAVAVMRFQINFDADRNKLEVAAQDVQRTLEACNAEHTRNRRANFIKSNTRLQRLKVTTRSARGYMNRW